MLFTSHLFIFVFVPAVLVVVFQAEKQLGRSFALLTMIAASLIFYYSNSHAQLSVLLASIVFNCVLNWLWFASQAIERYFAQRGLRYFVLASEGSGFRFTQLILKRLAVKPKILMIDVLEDTTRHVVLYPDRFFAQPSAFY
jgi:D-alanyl-lipoteichoic acid acyltransferase DltB (MBOAT superfamily)